MIYDTDGPAENWKFIFDLNVLALSVCTKEAIQSMRERQVDDGHIVHINRYVARGLVTRQTYIDIAYTYNKIL
jgi:NAD(P)-dependent dehydrogenase (short-subunit alcohol dehydrogenase family)